MGQNPINLAVRFLLEMFALLSFGVWGWNQGESLLRVVWAILVPLVAAALWGTFRVPNDPGRAPVPIPGLLRLGLEGAFFALATWAQTTAFSPTVAGVFGLVVLVHYGLSYDRLAWLFKH